MRFHVKFGQSKKIIEVENVNSLFSDLEKKFDINFRTHDLLCYDKEFDDWVSIENTVEELNNISDHSKLLIQPIGKCNYWCD